MKLVRLRWLVPDVAVGGWLIAVAVIAGFAALAAASLMNVLGVAAPGSDTIVMVACLLPPAGFALGLAAPSLSSLPIRLSRTHQEVPEARTPTAWAYAVTLGVAAGAGAAAIALEPVVAIAPIAGLFAASAVAACALAGLSSAARGALDEKTRLDRTPSSTQPRPNFQR